MGTTVKGKVKEIKPKKNEAATIGLVSNNRFELLKIFLIMKREYNME